MSSDEFRAEKHTKFIRKIKKPKKRPVKGL